MPERKELAFLIVIGLIIFFLIFGWLFYFVFIFWKPAFAWKVTFSCGILPYQVVMACRILELLYGRNHFRTNKSAAFYLNSMLYHSSQDVSNLEWYQNEFPKITKLTHLLASVDAINGRLIDINSNSPIFDDQIEHEMCTFKSLVRVFVGSPFVQDKMKRVLASSTTNTQHDPFTPFSKATEREPMVVDSLTKVSNFLNVSAQQRKLVRFRVCPQVTQHRMWTGALKEILNNFAVDLDSLGSQCLNGGTILGQQIVHSCLKFLTETAALSDTDSSSWMKLSPAKTVNSSDSQKWEDVLVMFNDLTECCRSETRLKWHVAKAEIMKEGLLHLKDILIDNSIGYKEARHQESLVQKKLSKTLGHSSRCLFTVLQYYLFGRVTDIEVDMCGGIYGNGNDRRSCLFMGRILTSDSEKMVGRSVKQLDRALGLFKFVWETAGMKGNLDLQGHMWCVGADNRMLSGHFAIAILGLAALHCYRGLTTMLQMVGLSLGEQHFIQGGIAQDLRCDGRKRLTYRPIYVKTEVIPQANGSARVRMGATDVIASVKAELGKPSLLQPDKGKVSIHIDCSSTAEPAFEGRGGDELSAELLIALQRCFLGAKSGAGAGIDLSSLVVIEGKICWDLYIDGLVVSSDGNLLYALGAAIKAALSNTGIPRVQVAAGASSDEQPEVDVSDEEFLHFDTSGVPVIVTLTKVGRHYIVDATSEEESQMSSAVSISINRQGHICGITKRGGAGLDPSIILDMISVAKLVSEQLINKLDSEIASAEAEDEP